MSARPSRRPTDETLAAIAATAVRQPDGSFLVKSSDGSRNYRVSPLSCTCPDFEHRGGVCKHRVAVETLCPAPSPHAVKALTLTDASLVEGWFLEGDPEPFECTWGEWRDANDFGDVEEVADALRVRGGYTGGGGAGPAWILQLRSYSDWAFKGF